MSTYLTADRFGTPTNAKKYTISVWFKLSKNTNNHILSYNYGNGQRGFDLIVRSNDQTLRVEDFTAGVTNYFDIRTNRVFRDYSAWYHIVFAYDSTQSTAADRVKLYVNGTQETSLAASTYPSQDLDSFIATTPQNNKGFLIGSFYNSAGNIDAGNYFAGYMSQFIFVDGTAYAASTFGSTNTNGIWISNSSPSVTYGTNGFKLDFAGTGASADASGFGADSSGNGNHFASTGLGTNPSTTDTCVNNFATFNLLDNDTITGAATLSNGNLSINANSNAASGCPSTIAVSNGAWYIEGKCLSSTFEIGVFGYGDGFSFNLANHPPYGDNGYPFAYEYGGNLKVNNSNVQTGLATYTTNDILAIALDMDNNTIKFFKNGSQVGTTITDSNLSTFAPYTFYVANHTGSNTNMFSLNTGNPSYTIASGNADANGYGNFEYAVPSGYYALCSKNLAAYGG